MDAAVATVHFGDGAGGVLKMGNEGKTEGSALETLGPGSIFLEEARG